LKPQAQQGFRRIKVNGTGKKKHSVLGKQLIASAREMAAHAKGKLTIEVHEVRVPRAVRRTQIGSPKR